MAIVRALKTGVWSDTTVWSTGALPTSADDVYSNTFTVTIDTSPTVLSISNAAATGVTIGGSFAISANGITLTCTGAGIQGRLTNSSTPVLTVSVGSGSTCTLVAAISGASGTSNAPGVNFSGAGTLNITGNCTSGGAGSYAVSNSSTGTINITGDVIGGGTSGSTGGLGARNTSTGSINITGTITGGPSLLGYGVTNDSTGTLTHIGTAQASATTAAIGVGGSVGQVTILSGPLLSTTTADGSASASGVNPVVALRWFPADTALATFTYTMRGATVSGSPSSRPARVLSLPDATANAYPAASNVRSGTVYGVGNAYTGTCAVPGAASVLVGVPVDATTGTATVSAADIRSAIGLASANLDTQFAAIPAAPSAAAIRTEMDSNSTKLANLDATVSSRLATASYTAPPSAATNASAVRSELETELARIDTTISSRLAPGGTLARVTLVDTTTTLTNAPDVPTESEIADAVRTELTPELSRISNAATTQEVSDIIEEAMQLP